MAASSRLCSPKFDEMTYNLLNSSHRVQNNLRVSADVQTKEEAEEIIKRFKQEVTMQAPHATYTPQIRQHAGSDSLQYRQLSTSTSRKPQPTHRYLVKAQQPGGSYELNASSISTFTAIDEDGNHFCACILHRTLLWKNMEQVKFKTFLSHLTIGSFDRRSSYPPPLQKTHGNGTSNERTIRSTTPLHSRHLISSYRRQVPGATNQSGGPLFRPVRDMGSVSGSAYEERKGGAAVTTVAPASPRSDLQQTQGVQDGNVSNYDSGTRLLSLSPTPSTLRQRFPTILRKTDSLPFPTQTALSVSPSSSLNQRPTQPNVAPRPPPASRPLPPHRLIQAAVRAVPPHRLIKTLPLPTVPPPKPPKPLTKHGWP
ncbi:hypothetical protein KIN20_000659 [Parelaphostrongylus tenuis]|uniref:Uncharacterized protein n=1 Tax=Parelaphostrongylus tenuis TaxID=148309 RepID=A0AAD5QFQ3_PARTN|nr:hypothetical protein KIN20_000659 [Parelaphostrongylus tenuis]